MSAINMVQCELMLGQHATSAICTLKPDGPSTGTQGLPTCDPSDADDACVTCAKASCCADYQACTADTNCACLVVCLSQGGTVAACTAKDNCGPFSSVSTTATTCLALACPGQCESAGGMSAGMCPSMTTGSGSSSSSGGAPSCTPGSFGSGDSCFSDGDCASCVCDPQTMTCD